MLLQNDGRNEVLINLSLEWIYKCEYREYR